MRGNYYQCDSCNKTITRRTNANRHIQVINQGKALAFKRVTGKSSIQKIRDIKKWDIGVLPPGRDFGFRKGPHRLTEEQEEDERFLIEILENMQKPFEELDLLVTGLDEKVRISYMADQMLAALLTSDPAKAFQNTVDTIKLFKLRNKIVRYI